MARAGLALACALVVIAPPAGRAQATVKPCTIDGRAARCGTIRVPEVRGATGGRQLLLDVFVLAGTGSRLREPLFVLVGGPGQAATSQVELFARMFDGVTRDRDIVLIDQRGSGGAHRLQCAVASRTFFVPADPAHCAARLSRKADLSAYGTASFVKDLDDARAALGYEQLSLYGASYGTRAAVAYAREYPQRVRSMVLVAPAPLTMSVLDSVEDDGRAALQSIVAECVSDRACGDAFPNLASALAASRRDLTDPYHLLGLLFLAYSSETARAIPYVLSRSAAGDRAPLAHAIEAFRADLLEQLSVGLHLAIMCSEELPYGSGRASPANASVARREYERACGSWPRAEPPVDLRRAVPLTHRALVVTGEWDPVTSPRWARVQAEQLSRSQLVIVPKSGHLLLGLERCLGSVAAEFLNGGAPDVSCLSRARRPPFVLRPPGGERP